MFSVLRNSGVTLCSSTRRLGVQKQQSVRLLGRGNKRIEPPELLQPGSGPVPIAKPIIFTGAVGVTCFVGASIWQYEEMRARMSAKSKQFFSRQHHKAGPFRQHVNTWWNSLTEGQKIFMPILGCNIAVFLAWRVPRFKNVMLNYFSADPTQRAVCWPMLLSTFSHYSLLHLAANMYVLHSFSSGAVATLGKEQFLGLYLGSGVVASLVSHMYKVVIKTPGRSLGASGAIMAILGYVCTTHPDTRLSIIFLPEVQFSAQQALTFLIAFDALGVIFRLKFFDHAAHLGGVLCGIMWSQYGHYLWLKREPLVTQWHEFRGSVTK